MTRFDYRRIANLEYFDSRDVIERMENIKRRIDKEMDSCNGYAVAHLRLERLVLWTILDELTEHFPPSAYSDVRTDKNCGVVGFAEHFATEYMKELAVDVGTNDPEAGWPLEHINWETSAESLKIDFIKVEILGSTFYLRY